MRAVVRNGRWVAAAGVLAALIAGLGALWLVLAGDARVPAPPLPPPAQFRQPAPAKIAELIQRTRAAKQKPAAKRRSQKR